MPKTLFCCVFVRNKMQDEQSCLICFESIDNNGDASLNVCCDNKQYLISVAELSYKFEGCKNTFHRKCLSKWREAKNLTEFSCPHCRAGYSFLYSAMNSKDEYFSCKRSNTVFYEDVVLYALQKNLLSVEILKTLDLCFTYNNSLLDVLPEWIYAARSGGCSLLHAAIDGGNLSIVQHLLEQQQINSTQVNLSGDSILMYSIKLGKNEMFDFFMKNSDPSLVVQRNIQECTPLGLAVQIENSYVFERLLSKTKTLLDSASIKQALVYSAQQCNSQIFLSVLQRFNQKIVWLSKKQRKILKKVKRNKGCSILSDASQLIVKRSLYETTSLLSTYKTKLKHAIVESISSIMVGGDLTIVRRLLYSPEIAVLMSECIELVLLKNNTRVLAFMLEQGVYFKFNASQLLHYCIDGVVNRTKAVYCKKSSKLKLFRQDRQFLLSELRKRYYTRDYESCPCEIFMKDETFTLLIPKEKEGKKDFVLVKKSNELNSKGVVLNAFETLLFYFNRTNAVLGVTDLLACLRRLLKFYNKKYSKDVDDLKLYLFVHYIMMLLYFEPKLYMLNVNDEEKKYVHTIVGQQIMSKNYIAVKKLIEMNPVFLCNEFCYGYFKKQLTHTPFMSSIWFRNFDMFSKLVDDYADFVDINKIDGSDNGNTVLMMASYKSYGKFLSKLLSKEDLVSRIDINLRNKDNRTAMMIAIVSDHKGAFKQLVKKYKVLIDKEHKEDILRMLDKHRELNWRSLKKLL